MKKMLPLLFVICLFIAALIMPGACEARDDEAPTIAVSESAFEEHEPDTLVLTVSVETVGTTASEASEKNAESAGGLIKALKELSGPLGQVRTSGFSITPVYDHKSPDRIRGYRAVNRVSVRTNRVKNAGALIDAAMEAGANRVDSIGFTLSEYEGLCPKVLAEASRKAAATAETVARSFGTEIRGVKSIRPDCSADSGIRAFAEGYMSKAATPIESGTLKVHGTVDAVFYLKK